MADVKAFDLPGLVADLADNMLVDEHWWESEQSDEEFKRQWKVQRSVGLVIKLVVTISTEVLSIVSHRPAEFFGIGRLLRAKTE